MRESTDGGEGRNAQYGVRVRVDRVQQARESGVAQVAQDGPADRSRPRSGADHRHGAGRSSGRRLAVSALRSRLSTADKYRSSGARPMTQCTVPPSK